MAVVEGGTVSSNSKKRRNQTAIRLSRKRRYVLSQQADAVDWLAADFVFTEESNIRTRFCLSMGDPHNVNQAASIQRFIESMPATRYIGLEVDEIDRGRCVVTMPIRPEVTVDGEVVQGGIVAVLADYAAVAAAGSTLEPGWRVATLSGETHNLAPAKGKLLVAVGEIVYAGKRHLVARADVYSDSKDGPHCLTGLFTAVGIRPS